MPAHRSTGAMQQRILTGLAAVPAGEWVPAHLAAGATTDAERTSARRAAASLAANGDIETMIAHHRGGKYGWKRVPTLQVRLVAGAAEAAAASQADHAARAAYLAAHGVPLPADAPIPGSATAA